jgi:hypothetical protein
MSGVLQECFLLSNGYLVINYYLILRLDMQTQTKDQNRLNDWLQICQKNFGAAPRSFNWIDRITYLSIRTPLWAQNDTLQTFFKNQSRLMCQGNLVWGQVVQANTALFIPGRTAYPADVIFPTKQIPDFEPEILTEIATIIFRLKGTEPTDPLLLKVAKHLTDEYDRTFGLFIPSSFCLNIPCELSTIYIDRKHLPNGYLSRSLFPLIVNSKTPKIATILPSKYWPPAMIDWWAK